MSKIGRPKLDKQAARTARLHVVLTEAERLDLVERAAVAGATLSDFVRTAALRSRLPARTAPQSGDVFSADDRRALVNVGNNLNQIARVMHSGRTNAQLPELAEAIDKLNAVLDRYLPQ